MRLGPWWTTKHKIVVGAAVAAVLVTGTLVAWAASGDGDGSDTVTASDTTLEPETTTTTTTTVPTTTSTTAPPATPSTAPPTTAPRVRAPGQPTNVEAGPGGGSGEVAVRWGPVAGATGYRVLRCDRPDGTYVVTADVDVATGAVTRAADVVNVWSENHTYWPEGGPGLTTPDTASWFEYIDVGMDPRWYMLVAYNAAGAGPASAVVWSGPP